MLWRRARLWWRGQHARVGEAERERNREQGTGRAGVPCDGDVLHVLADMEATRRGHVVNAARRDDDVRTVRR